MSSKSGPEPHAESNHVKGCPAEKLLRYASAERLQAGDGLCSNHIIESHLIRSRSLENVKRLALCAWK